MAADATTCATGAPSVSDCSHGFRSADLCAPLLETPPAHRIEAEIDRLRRERNAVILAHYYQDSELQDIADFVGDSLELSRRAAETRADVIAFCGVHFMAETAKVLNPEKIVVVPDLDAGCSLADRCPAPAFVEWLRNYPDHTVVSYINCSAAVKAVSDVICTSANACKIVASLPSDRPIVFAPDRHLGRWVARETGRDLVLWPGFCIVHEQFSARRLVRLKAEHPRARVLAHPECEEAVLAEADFIGSTSALLRHVENSSHDCFIIATEAGILHQMRRRRPDATFISAQPHSGCDCALCPYMRLNTFEKLYLALRDLRPRVEVDAEVRQRARAALDRMLELSA